MSARPDAEYGGRQRTRVQPGPRLLMALAWLSLSATVVRAHDPGLSALDVNVQAGSVSVSLSLAAADVALVVTDADDTRQQLVELARDSIRVSVDDERVLPKGSDVSMDPEGARIRLAFAIPERRSTAAAQPAAPARRLDIASDVPKRLARGHRELLTVRIDESVAIERLLDVESGSANVDLGAGTSDARARASATARVWSFLVLGIRHILTGYDHLVFLAGLLLASCTLRQIVASLSVFTLAHSVSLAMVVAGRVQAPASIVEPLIAASIAWIGVENLLRGPAGDRWRDGSGKRTPVYALVFGFGLIHGFGLAGALTELGVGTSVGDLALALLSFNAGVESGQLAAAAAALPLVWTIRARPRWQARFVPMCSVLIAAAGAYWLIERL